MTELLREPRLFIGGEWVAGGGEDCAVENPATEEVTAVVAQGSQQDVNDALAAARGAFEGWAATPATERAAERRRLHGVISAPELFHFARTLTGCVAGSLDAAIDLPRYFEHVQRGRLDLNAMVTRHGALADVEQAMTEMAAGQGIRTLITPAGA